MENLIFYDKRQNRQVLIFSHRLYVENKYYLGMHAANDWPRKDAQNIKTGLVFFFWA